MSTISNSPDDRTFVYENSPFQFSSNAGISELALVKNWIFNPDMADFDIDRIDTAEPIFTKKSDILGTFEFDTVNTVDFYDPGSANDPITYAYWALQIAKGEPVKVNFIVKMNAPKSGGDKVATINFVGRIMSIPQNRNQDTGVHTFTVNGEITEIIDITRTVS